MHETIIINKILKEVKRKARGERVKSVTLEVGELAHLPADELKEILKATADFEALVKSVKAKVKCRCGYIGVPRILAHEHDFVLFECPKCKATPKIVSGEEIILKSIKTA